MENLSDGILASQEQIITLLNPREDQLLGVPVSNGSYGYCYLINWVINLDNYHFGQNLFKDIQHFNYQEMSKRMLLLHLS